MKARNTLSLSLSLLAMGLMAASGCQPGGALLGNLFASPGPASSPGASPTASGSATPDDDSSPTPSASPTQSPTPTPSASPTQSPAPTPAPLSQVVTMAGYGTAGFANGSGASAGFNYPAGVALHTDGSLLIADQRNHRIRRMTSEGVVTTFAGSGTQGFAEGAGSSAKFSEPTGVAVDPEGNVYVADQFNHRVRKIDAAGQVTTLAGSGTQGFLDGDAATAQFRSPQGIAVDASASVYVADTINHRIRKIAADGQVTTYAGSGVSGLADGEAAAARFNQPYGLCVDSAGVVYVADRLNHAIRKITPDGQVTTLAGNGSSGFADGAGATQARFNYPWGLAVGRDSHLYVSDGENQRIRRIAPDGTVATIAGSGGYGFASGWGYSPRSALTADFRYPAGLAVDSSGAIAFADMWNHAIRRLY